MEKMKFYFWNRFVLFVILIMAMFVLNWFFIDSILPSPADKYMWFYSGILILVISILFVEPYYSSPKNVITNVLSLIFIVITLDDIQINGFLKWSVSGILIFLLVLAVFSVVLYNKNESENSDINKMVFAIKRIASYFGKAKILYSLMFIYFLLSNYWVNNHYVQLYFIFWFFIIMLEPNKIHYKFRFNNGKISEEQIGAIIGVQAKKIFIVKFFEDTTNFVAFNAVKFKYNFSSNDKGEKIGIILDTYLLNNEKWGKILEIDSDDEYDFRYKNNTVYKIDNNRQKEIKNKYKTDNLVGILHSGSNIDKIIFEYREEEEKLEAGMMLELSHNKKRLFYQVINGKTDIEKIEELNKNGIIFGEAIQLGEWQNEKLSFYKYGWVPKINTPIYIAETSDLEKGIVATKKIEYPIYKVGVIPSTSLPALINLNLAVSHHLALLGVTGSGKSFLAREIIKEIISDTKVFCIDFTGEYTAELKEFTSYRMIEQEKMQELEELITKKEDESKQKNKNSVLNLKKNIQNRLEEYVEKFVKNEINLTIFELPELSNTVFIIEFTQLFLEAIFNYAKKNIGQKICIVLEEAHTIIPETSFLGDYGDYGSTKALVSKMSQIALQGRKYGVGLMILAQRTANVSKTVLTQCNTVICFQAFDETSFNFLGNYVGKDMVQMLPNLKPYHAIIAGKAALANVPMVIDLKRS